MARRRDQSVLIWPDTHLDEHDPRAVACALSVLGAMQPDTVVVMGDFLNCTMFSTHPKGSLSEARQESFLVNELEPGLALLSLIAEHCKRIVYIEGNHEARVMRYCANNDKTGIYDLISPERFFGAHFRRQRFPLTWVPYFPDAPGLDTGYYLLADQTRSCSAILCTHGWSTSRHATAKHREVAGHYTIIHGHTHRRQMDVGKDPVTDMEYEAWSFGCLCSLRPQWIPGAKPVDWCHGVGQVFIGTETWDIKPVAIRTGYAVMDGGKEVRSVKPWVHSRGEAA